MTAGWLRACLAAAAAVLLASAPSIDPRQRRAQAPLQGDVPSPSRPPPGCAFHTRCPRAEPRCSQELPVLRAVGADPLAACHFAEETPT